VIGDGQGNGLGFTELRTVTGIVAVPALCNVSPVL